jgi:exodeoxyribonuclease V alpha subunit
MAERIVDHFGQTTLEVIEQEPGRLVQVPGLGPKRTAMITTAWEEQRSIKEVMAFLQGVGVSTSLALRIYKTYRDDAIDVVRREPYRLAAEVWGIGFKTADQIAQRLAIPHDSTQRVKAGLQFALSQASEDGHCYLPETELVTETTGLLGVDQELAERCLEELVAERARSPSRSPPTWPRGPRGNETSHLAGPVPPCRGRAGRRAAAPAACTRRSAGQLPGGGLDRRAGLAAPAHRCRPGGRAG